jgi:hypothetical protein
VHEADAQQTACGSCLAVRVCLIRHGASEATNHQVNHRDADHRFTGLWQQLIILAQPPVAIEPPQRPLDNPPLGAHLKALGTGGPLDDVQAHAPLHPQRLHPGHPLASIGLIGPNQPQTRQLASQNPEQAFGTITILPAGGGDDDSQDYPEGIDQDVSRAPRDGLVRIVPADPPFSVVLTD